MPNPSNAPPDVWGSNEHGQSIDSVLALLTSIGFARGGTWILGSLGYQVLDSTGTSALKQSCESKPLAANIALSEAGTMARGWAGPRVISTSPNRPYNPPTDKLMGLSIFDGMSPKGTPKFMTAYFPFTRGLAPTSKEGSYRISAAQSPLWKLPTRLVLHAVNGDEVEARMEWLSDPATVAKFHTAPCVMQDRFINVRAKLSTDSLAEKAAQIIVSGLKWRLNSPMEGCGTLEWAAHRFQDGPLTDTVTPFAPGMMYQLFVGAHPVFGAGPEDWNLRGRTMSLAGGAADKLPAARADYITVTPKFSPTQAREFLAQLPQGFESLQLNKPTPMTFAFLYSTFLPRELLFTRTIQASDTTWFTLAADLRPPQPRPLREEEGDPRSVGLRPEVREPVTLRAAVAVRGPEAKDGGEAWSASVGLQQSVVLKGLDRYHQQGLPGLGLSFPVVRPFGSLSVAVPGGTVQAAVEAPSVGGDSHFRAGAMLSTSLSQLPAARLLMGLRWESRKPLFFGMGVDMEL